MLTTCSETASLLNHTIRKVSRLSEPVCISQKAALCTPTLVLLSMLSTHMAARVCLSMGAPQGWDWVCGIPSEQHHPVLGLAGLGTESEVLTDDDNSLSLILICQPHPGRQKDKANPPRRTSHGFRFQGSPPAFPRAGKNAGSAGEPLGPRTNAFLLPWQPETAPDRMGALLAGR